MKSYDKKRKSRVDLYDIVNNLHDIYTVGLLPFPEEYDLICPIKGRPETVTYLAMTSWGDLCHINIQFRPNEIDSKFMHARIDFKLHLKDSGTFHANNEDILNLEDLKDYFGKVKTFRIGSFLIEIKRPFSNARLVFRGFLNDEKTNRKRFATINLFLISLGKVYDNLAEFDQDFIKQQFQDEEIQLVDSIEQWIQIKGQIKLEDANESRDFFLWGLYQKAFETCPVSLNHFLGWNHKGMAFHIVQWETEDEKKFVYGHFNMGLGMYYPLTELPKIQLNKLENVKNSKFDINLPKMKRVYSVQIGGDERESVRFDDDFWAFPIKLKEYEGYGFWFRQHLKNSTVRDLIKNIRINKFVSDEKIYFVSLNEKSAQNEQLTGGKGSSLAVLNEFSKHSSSVFQVPEALIVTSDAYERFLNFYPNLLKKNVEEFKEKILNCRGNQNEIKLECEKMQQAFKNNPFPNELKEDFQKKIIQVFGEDFEKKENRFAVRSSAVGEDSEEMSAAGQMTSFLGVSGFDSICQSLVSCWASQFGQTAVEYKRGYGQRLNSPMAVVIQKMVPSEVAGVMFTCSPLDGNERFITITANYGLGESVVSGQVEPDTYTVKVDVDSESRKVLEIESVRIGAKKHAIHMEAQNVTKTQELSHEEQKARCLNDDQVLELAKIGLEVHNHYGNARDIEFGFSNDSWYILQSRPVTNLESLTEWEIMHEMDTGFLSENECLSRANVGEVMPGASSYNLIEFVNHPWPAMVFAENCSLTGQQISDFNPYFNLGFCFLNNVAFFAVKSPIGIMGRKKPDDDNKFIQGCEYAMIGHKNDDMKLFKDIFEKMPERNNSLMKGFRLLSTIVGKIITAHKSNKKAYEKFSNYTIHIDVKNEKSASIFFKIFEEMPKIRETLMNHLQNSQVSMLFNALLYQFLSTKLQIQDEQQILDLFSRITSSVDDVLSAQVPKRLLEVSKDISDREKFLQLSDDEAIQYLKENNEKFNEFLKEFGHRGYKELDLHVQQWSQNAKPLVNTLKSLLNDQQKNENDKNINKKYDLNDYPGLSFIPKKILEKIIIPKTHQGIRNRELGKNLVIKSYDQFRKAFYMLGDKLVEEGKIPDRELIFFLLNTELREIVQDQTRPLTILNAKNRLRLHSKKEEFRFDEKSWGYDIKPRNLQPKKDVPIGAVKLNGVPISSGKITARCCVAETLEDAKNIQKGDILITYSTDIGWSPYFAALGGLVTEIGGLVSHGAVIAREYGLPCLVGVDDATSHFKTGEMLMLDTSAGFIARIEPTADDEKPNSEEN